MFESAPDAVQCGVEIQHVIEARNATWPTKRRMPFRVGISYDSIIEEDHRVYGPAVFMAVIIEGLAEPGGICLSESVYSQAASKLALDYEDLGLHDVKNIPDPVRVYRIRMGSRDVAETILDDEQSELGGPILTVAPPSARPDKEIRRYLAAALIADVKGFMKMMSQDEEGTIRMLTAHRKAMSVAVQQHGGQVVDSPGDDVFAVFDNPLAAAGCAIEIQQELGRCNADLPAERRMEWRIGIDHGDIIEEHDRIYGNPINIAAQLEGIAKAGGICISGSVYDHVAEKLPARYEDMGKHPVRGMPDQIQVYGMS